MKRKFTKIYHRNLFCGKESRSGGGSSVLQTRVIRQEIPLLLKELNTELLVDAPCGDFLWMRHVILPVRQYIGIDIVDELIVENQKKFGNHQRSFITMNIVEDVLPRGDLILCRDCLVHLSFDECRKVLEKFRKSDAKYLLTTTFANRHNNYDLGKGLWRTINLQLPPFNFPEPIRIINENCTELQGEYSDKSLGLWLLEDIHFLRH